MPHLRPAPLTLLLLAAGCASPPYDDAPAAGITTNPVTGNVSTVADRDLDSAHAAVRAALSELNFTVTKDLRDPAKAVLEGRDAGDRSITVQITKLGENSSRLDISGGPLHRSLAHSVMTQVRARL